MNRLHLPFLLVLIGAALPCIAIPTQCDASALSVLQHVSTRLSHARSFDYTSTVQLVDPSGHSKKYFVHATVQKPCRIRFSFSQTALDDPKSSFVVNNATAVYEYDGSVNKFKLYQPQLNHFNLDHDLVGAKALMTMMAEFLKDQPLMTLFPNDPDNPLVLTTRSRDIPGASTVTANVASTDASENLVKLVIPPGDYIPKRLQLSVLRDGVETIVYQEDFTTFTLDGTVVDAAFTPNIPKDAVPWTDDEIAQMSGVHSQQTVSVHPGVTGVRAPAFSVLQLPNDNITTSSAGFQGKSYVMIFVSQLTLTGLPDVESVARQEVSQNSTSTLCVECVDSRGMAQTIPGVALLGTDYSHAIANSFGVTTFPAVFLINRAGIIADSWDGETWPETVARIAKDAGLLGQ